MALKACRECNTQVSTTAKICPHCGVRNPTINPIRRGAAFLISAFLAFILFVIVGIATKYESSSRSPAQPSSSSPPAQTNTSTRSAAQSRPALSNPPLARDPYNTNGDKAHVLACRSKNDYTRFASIYATKSPTVIPVRRAVNAGQCTDLNDRATFAGWMQPHHTYRVDRVEQGFACVWVSHLAGGCFWTSIDNLHHIGRGPQLSEDQFRDVRTLVEQETEMFKVELDYFRRAETIKNEQGDRQEEARLRRLYEQAQAQPDEIEKQIARFEPTEAKRP